MDNDEDYEIDNESMSDLEDLDIDYDEDDEDLDEDIEEKKPKKAIVKKTSNNSKGINDDLKKKLIKVIGIILLVIVVLVIISSISSKVSKKNYSYEEIEQIMEDAAKTYFKDHSDYLPKRDNQIVELNIINLVQEGYMKDLSEYTKEGVMCTGKISVSKNNNEYLYLPILNCGDAYSGKSLVDAVKENSNIVSSGYGLYKMNNFLVFRGEVVNNYVKIDDHLWRIIKLDSNNSAYLIAGDNLNLSLYWDNRYNEQVGYNIGINNYSTSRMKEYLTKIYTTPDKYENILSNHSKAQLESYDLCVGKRFANSSNNTNSIECSKHESNQKYGLITLSDYINASIDPKCKTAKDENCQNYNYLVSNYNWWTATAVDNTTSKVYMINQSGRIEESNCIAFATIRPVIKLNNRAMIKGGTGSESDPYILK